MASSSSLAEAGLVAWRAMHRLLHLAALAVALVALASPARGVAPIEVAGGPVTLPVGGLTVDLPTKPGVRWEIRGQLRQLPDGRLMGSDTIAQRLDLAGVEARRELIVQVGPLASAGCDALLASLAPPAMSRELRRGAVTVAGATWAMATGVQRGADDARTLTLLCATHEGLTLYIAFTAASAGAPSLGEAQRALSQRADLVAALRAAFDRRRVGDAHPTQDAAVTLTDGFELPTSLRLPVAGWTLTLPRDGFAWALGRAPRAPPEAAEDVLLQQAPTLPYLQLSIGRWESATCRAHIAHNTREGGAWQRGRTPAGLPAGWVGGMWRGDGERRVELVCHPLPTGVVAVALRAWPPLADLSAYRPILGAIAKAAGARSVTGGEGDAIVPPLGPPKADRLMAWFGTEVVVSHRGVEGPDRPDAVGRDATRLLWGGLDLGLLGGEPGLWLARLGAHMTLDWEDVLDDARDSSPRWGGMHLELALDAYWAPLRGDTTVAIGAGWHGLSGPLTKNSSLALSALVAHLPEDPAAFAWTLRVTPAQLFASNERQLLSPLTVQWRAVIASRFAVGLELQYVAAPSAGVEDLPAEGFAVLVRFGVGSHR